MRVRLGSLGSGLGLGLGGDGHEGHPLVVRERGCHHAKQDDEELECGAPARVDGDALLVELEHGLDAQLDVPRWRYGGLEVIAALLGRACVLVVAVDCWVMLPLELTWLGVGLGR